MPTRQKILIVGNTDENAAAIHIQFVKIGLEVVLVNKNGLKIHHQIG